MANIKHNCPRVAPDSLTESDEEYHENEEDSVDDDFSNCSSSMTLKLPEVQISSSSNNSDLLSEHIYALPFPKLANPNADTLNFKHHGATRSNSAGHGIPGGYAQRLSSPETPTPVSISITKPASALPSVPPLHRRNTDTILKHPSLHRPITPRPQVSKYGTNPRLAAAKGDWSMSPGDWGTRSFGRFKKTESAILPSGSELNSSDNDQNPVGAAGDYIDVNGRMYFKRGSLLDHPLFSENKLYEKRSTQNKVNNGNVPRNGGGVMLEPVQLLALHDNGQLRPVSFMSQQENANCIYESGLRNYESEANGVGSHVSSSHGGYSIANKIDKNRRPVSMINLGTNSSSGGQKHLQILTQCYEVESSKENLDVPTDNLVSNANEQLLTTTNTTNGNIIHSTTSNNNLNLKQSLTSTVQSKVYTNGVSSNGNQQTTKSAINLNQSQSPPPELEQPSNYQRLLNSPKKTQSFMETYSYHESTSITNSSVSGGSTYMATTNRFEQRYKFDLNSDSEITWGDAEMSFGIQVTKEHVVNRNYYYDFRVTATEGSNVNYSSSDREFDFVTTNFPLVETKFFESELRRIYPTVVIPDCPQFTPTAGSGGAYCGTLALEIWLSWLGRHPVVGKSPIFWHMLRYAKSKDWHSQKSSIRKVVKFIRNQSTSSSVLETNVESAM